MTGKGHLGIEIGRDGIDIQIGKLNCIWIQMNILETGKKHLIGRNCTVKFVIIAET